MKNKTINDALRRFVQTYLTPTEEQRKLVSAIYEAVCSVLGRHRCRQIGSYPRYTAIRPPHDLDVLYEAGGWSGEEPDAAQILAEIEGRLKSDLVVPAGFAFTVALQTHSITISFTQNGEEIFAVDVVPGWTTGIKNEFDDDIYRVPEILLKGHKRRLKMYKRLAEKGGRMGYILSDPKGYISVAAAINDDNPDFRKSVKMPKKWSSLMKEITDEFKMKSFHIEQIITLYFKENPTLEILEAVTKFFVELPEWISHSQIPDRADSSRNIDAYVDELTAGQKAVILDARDTFLERLRAFDGSQDAQILFEPKPRAAAAPATTSTPVSAPAIITDRSTVSPRPPFGE